MKKRLRKLLLSLFIFLSLDEFVVHQTQSMILVPALIQEAPIIYTAATVACTYLASRLHDHSFKEGAALTTIAQEYAQQLRSTAQIEQTITTVQEQLQKNVLPTLEHKYVQTTVSNKISLSAPSEITLFHASNGIHTTHTHDSITWSCGNTYMQVSVKPAAQPRRITGYDREQNYIDRYLANDSYFKSGLKKAITECLDFIINADRGSYAQKVEARLQLIHLRLPGNHGTHLHKLINHILWHYFSNDGTLYEFINYNNFERSIYTYFLKPLYDYDTCLKMLDARGLARGKAFAKDPGLVSRIIVGFFTSPYHIGKFFKRNTVDPYPYDLRNSIKTNQTNQKLLELIDACKNNNWQKAQKLRYCSPIHSEKIYQEYYGHYRSQKYNNYGIYRICEQDPLWQSMPIDQKRKLSGNQKALKAFNAELLMRKDWKQKIQKTWQIPDDAHYTVHHALYNLAGISSTEKLIDTIFALIENNPDNGHILKAFFCANGILKDIDNPKYKNITINTQLSNTSDLAAFHHLNRLIYAHHTTQAPSRAALIQESINCLTQLIENELFETYHNEFENLYQNIITHQSDNAVARSLKNLKVVAPLACSVSWPEEEDAEQTQWPTCGIEDAESKKPEYSCGTGLMEEIKPLYGCPPDFNTLHDAANNPEFDLSNGCIPEHESKKPRTSCNGGMQTIPTIGSESIEGEGAGQESGEAGTEISSDGEVPFIVKPEGSKENEEPDKLPLTVEPENLIEFIDEEAKQVENVKKIPKGLTAEEESMLIEYVEKLLQEIIPLHTNGIIQEANINNSIRHLFSKNHIKYGILDLGKDKFEILKKLLYLIYKADENNLLQEGSNQIHTSFNNIKVVIRLNINQGTLRKINSFVGTTNNHIGNTFDYYEEL